jgi:hypothetical protein
MRNNVRNNDAMTGNGREALRIPVRGAAPAPHPAPAAVPEIEAAAPHPRAAHTKFRDERAALRGTPTHVRGRACAWGTAERASYGGRVAALGGCRAPEERVRTEGAVGRRHGCGHPLQRERLAAFEAEVRSVKAGRSHEGA